MTEAMVVRPRRPEDAADLYEVFQQPRCIWGTLQLPSKSPEEVRRMVEQTDRRHHGMVAEVGGKVVGDAGLFQGEGREAHIARLGMLVHDAYQGLGVGSRLMEALLELGDDWLGVRRYELEVYEDNEKAVRLYRKFGFEVEGRQTDDTFRDGRFVDSLVMARLVGATSVEDAGGTALGANDGAVTGVADGGRPAATVRVRPAGAEDAVGLQALYADPRVLRYTLYLPDETVAAVRARLAGAEPARHWFVVENGGIVVGEAILTQGARRRAHMAGISSAVAGGEDAEAAAVAWAGLEATVDLADRWLNLRRLKCRLYADDHVGRAVLEELGFREEVVFRKAAFRLGRYEDLVGFGRVRA